MVQMLTSWTMQTFIQSNNVMRVSNENRLTLNRHRREVGIGHVSEAFIYLL